MGRFGAATMLRCSNRVNVIYIAENHGGLCYRLLHLSDFAILGNGTMPDSTVRDIAQPYQDAELFRPLVHCVKDYAIFALDVDGYIVTWNRGAQLVKGYAAEEIIGQHIKRFYTHEDLAVDKPLQLLKKATEQGRAEDEGWRVRKDGSRFWASVVITALYDEDGQLRAYAKITRDLTERRQAEEILRQANQDLERRVTERTAELERANENLEERLSELERFHDVMVSRELRMMELKIRVQQLEAEIRGLRGQRIVN
jgi:PAS domain S-box-containing protein